MKTSYRNQKGFVVRKCLYSAKPIKSVQIKLKGRRIKVGSTKPWKAV